MEEQYREYKVSGVPSIKFVYSVVAKKSFQERSITIMPNKRLPNKKLSYVQFMNLLKALSSNFLCLTVFTNTFFLSAYMLLSYSPHSIY